MGWTNSVITNAGVRLLNESLTGHTLTIDHVVSGVGVLPSGELPDATDVAEPKQILSLLGIEDFEGGKKLKIQINNKGITEKYVLHQIAVFARMDDLEKRTMLLIMQDEHGIEVPTETENPDFLFEVYAVIAISNEAEIRVLVDSSASASVGFVTDSIASVRDEMICLTDFELVIPAASWLKENAADDDYIYYADVGNDAIILSCYPEVILNKKGLKEACKCGMAPTVEIIEAGGVRFFAQEIPQQDICGVCRLWIKGSRYGNGGNIYVLPVATDTTLGGVMVKDGSGLNIDEKGYLSIDAATDEEVSDAMEELFGESGTIDGGSSGGGSTSGSSYEIADDQEVSDMNTDIFG